MLDKEIAFPSDKDTTAKDDWKGDNFCLVSVHCQVNFIELLFSEKWGLITNLPFQKNEKKLPTILLLFNWLKNFFTSSA